MVQRAEGFEGAWFAGRGGAPPAPTAPNRSTAVSSTPISSARLNADGVEPGGAPPFGARGLAYATVLLTVITILFGELLPKALGVSSIAPFFAVWGLAHMPPAAEDVEA